MTWGSRLSDDGLAESQKLMKKKMTPAPDMKSKPDGDAFATI